jgi:hypothetical protein
MANEHYRHIILDGPTDQRDFTTTLSPREKRRIISKDRSSHSSRIRHRLEQAWRESEYDQAAIHTDRNGVYIEFKSDPNADLVTKSLEDMRSKKVRLLNVRKVEHKMTDVATGEEVTEVTTYATVYIAHDKKGHFFKKIQQYAEEETETGKWKNADLINSIADISQAIVGSFWTDLSELTPADDPKWCEVWLSNDSKEAEDRFDELLKNFQIESKDGIIRFPERSIKVVFANQQQLEKIIQYSDDIAEYRLAKETSAFWSDMENSEQAEWVDDLRRRTVVDLESDVAVCILDTGVNNWHPLLEPVLPDEACLTVDPGWGVHDHDGHGTLMAGVAAYGNLMGCLSGNGKVKINHRLESVKIIPQPPDTNQPDLWGYITAQAISRALIQSPEAKRINSLAVTAPDSRDQGRPSSWSGALDQLSAGSDGDVKRLFVVSAGNNKTDITPETYPNAQITDSVHDPAQAWNALTVGAYTDLVNIQDPKLAGYTPVAPQGSLSPFSTTSTIWDGKWPVKPEIVMEGGNAVHDGYGQAVDCEDLSLLSTHWKPTESHFWPFNMTSAATAQAACFAAKLQYQYPEIWPETIRALMIHSASWTDAMLEQFRPDESKGSYAKLMRVCGYGVPDIGRALFSASNSLTLISQAEMQPYDKKPSGSGYQTKDMHLYDLPWPREVLLGLPSETQVQMRITLSYFIEPGPGEIGWQDRYRYASHGLRFDVNSPGETQGDFIRRINKAARNDDEGSPDTGSASSYWVIGSQARNKGSVHSDIWNGTAADLATSNQIAVYPTIGWWRERAHLGKWGSKTRYALIVSINSPEEDIDIYTPVANQIGITVPVEVKV